MVFFKIKQKVLYILTILNKLFLITIMSLIKIHTYNYKPELVVVTTNTSW